MAESSGRNSTAVTNQTDTQITTGAGKYFGIGVRSVTGATVVSVYDGTSASGKLIDQINLAAAATQITHWFAPAGIVVTTGIFLDVDANTASAVVYW